VLYLNEPSLIICNAIPTMGVLCSLTVGRDKIDQGCPIGSTVNQWFEILIDEEAFAAGVLHHDWIIGGTISDLKEGGDILAVVTESISDDMTIIWVGTAS